MTEEEKLKSIVGYLPYGVKGFNQRDKEVEFTLADGRYLLDRNFRPLLYPLSSLTEYREDLGFVPVEYFEITDDSDSYPFEFDSGNIKLIRDLVSISKNNCSFDINFLPNVVVDKFKEWHIDYQNLIEKEIAIDKTKIK